MAEHLMAAEGQTGESWIIPRPTTILMDLPVAHRWEVTRRHPYYLRFWQLAHQHHQHPSQDPDLKSQQATAALILQAIGIIDDPPHPGASAESLGAGQLSQGWVSGAVAPITFRGLAGMLLVGLPADARLELGQFLLASAAPTEDPTSQVYYFLSQLQRLQHPALDAFPNGPVIGVNVTAPQRVVVQAVEQLVREWKEQRDIPERRRRDDKLEEYLNVWDLREGWVADHYDGNVEQTLRQIAQQLRIPLSTIANRYRSAFRLIVGREYSPELWARLLGTLKAYEWLEPDELPRRTLHRPWRNRQQYRPVTEAALQAPDEGQGATGILNTIGITNTEIGYMDLVLDIRALITQGRSDAEICAALELKSPQAEGLIDHLRQRQQDLL